MFSLLCTTIVEGSKQCADVWSGRDARLLRKSSLFLLPHPSLTCDGAEQPEGRRRAARGGVVVDHALPGRLGQRDGQRDGAVELATPAERRADICALLRIYCAFLAHFLRIFCVPEGGLRDMYLYNIFWRILMEGFLRFFCEICDLPRKT